MGNLTWRIMKGIISRTLYAGHAALAIYRVYRETLSPYYFALTACIVLLIIEGVITLYFRDGKDFGWFSPSVFIYLSGLVPSVWILELGAVASASNLTSECINSIHSSAISQASGFQQLYASLQQKQNWLLAVEQGTLFILIIGRWLAPLGKLTRNQRSQLLLIYIGTAADIIELFETFKEPIVRSNRLLVMVIMAVWSWSLLQYTVVFVSAKQNAKGSRIQIRPDEMGSNKSVRRSPSAVEDKGCCDPEVVTPLIALIMQDCPFLGLRFYLLYLGVLSPMILFFTAKNILLLMLQFYRLVIVCSDGDRKNRANSWAGNGQRDEVNLEIVD